jgi:hypothetical protein
VHQPTRTYVERRLKEGLSKTDIVRCLERYSVREVCQNLRSAAPDEPLLRDGLTRYRLRQSFLLALLTICRLTLSTTEPLGA